VDQHLLKILEVEVGYQCEIGLAGGRLLETAHGEAVEGGRGYSDNIWFALQGILGIGANAAKLLWGSQGPETEAEREPLRSAAGVTDESPLKPRHVRNAFEHFDERIVDWHRQTDANVYASRQIGTDPAWPPTESRFGYYDPKERVVTFLSHSVSILDLLAEFERVRSNLTAD
jgi:hypothetical protein